MAVKYLRLIDAAKFQVCVEGHMEVNDLVDKLLHTEIVDEEFDLSDVFLDTLGIVRHG